MSKEPDDRNVSRREFFARAGGGVAAGYLFVDSLATPSSGGPAPVTYTVTVDATQDPITYRLPNGSDASMLPVQPGDKVTWVAKTNKPNNHLAILFIGNTPYDTPFVHPNGQSVFAFHGSHSDVVGKDAFISPSGGADTWKYYVGVWDNDGSQTVGTVTDDPTIIIGKGMIGAESAKAYSTAARRLLNKAAAAYPEDADKLNRIIAQLNELIDKWGALSKQKK